MAACFRRLRHSARVWLMLLALQLNAAVGLAEYRGSLARVWLLTTPILALVLVGVRSAWIAALASAALILAHAVATVLGVNPWRVPGFDENGPTVVIFMAIVWLGILLVLLFLLQRLQSFHMRTLTAERVASAGLEEEHRALMRETIGRMKARSGPRTG